MTMIAWPRIENIPNLDPPLPYSAAGMTEHFPLIMLPSGHEAVHLTSFADVRSALSQSTLSRETANEFGAPSFFPTPLPSGILLTLDPPEHQRIRKVVSREFIEGSILKRRPKIENTARHLLRDIDAQPGPFDLVNDFVIPLAWEVTSDIVGLPPEDRDVVHPRAMSVMMMDWDRADDVVDAFLELWSYLGNFTSGARPSPPGSLIALLRSRQQEGYPLTDEEITGLQFTIVLASSQAVASVLAKAIYVLLVEDETARYLLENPAMQDRWIEEVLRLIPVGEISIVPRVAHEDVQLPGGVVRAGEAVFADSWSANRDPSMFTDPTVFDPTRPVQRHLGLGYGVHQCLGASLARTLLRVAVGEVTTRLSKVRLAEDPASVAWDSGFVLRRPRRLLVCPS